MTDTSSQTDNIFAFLLALAIAIPAFLGQDQTMKPVFYALVVVPALAMILARKIHLIALFKDYPYVFLLTVPMLYWSTATLWSDNPENFSGFLRRSLTTFVFVIAVAHTVATHRQGLVRYLDLALFLVAIAASIKLGSIFFDDTSSKNWRLGNESVFNRPLHAAHYFGCFATYALVRAYQQANSRRWMIYALALAPCALYVLMTYSRGPLISYVLVFLVISIFWYKKPVHALLALGLSAGVSYQQLDVLTQRGASFRDEIWQKSLELIQNNFWLGVGNGTPLDMPYGENKMAPHAHNLFLDMFTRSGIIGFLLVTIIAVFVLWRAYRARPNEQLAIATLLFFFLAMMTDVQKLITSPSGGYVVFWLPLTALLVLSSRPATKGKR
ncbi:MAG: O-antigen ligase family protein [Halioglobus sp.]